jgi:Flp pilus assembly CpaF family ATPase
MPPLRSAGAHRSGHRELEATRIDPAAFPPATLISAIPATRTGGPGGHGPTGIPSGAPIAGRPPAPKVDFEAVRVLRGQIGEALTRWLKTQDEATQEEIDAEREQIAVEIVARYADTMRRGGTPLTGDDEYGLLVAVRADMVGLGRLQSLLTDDTVEEVHILGCDRVRITRRNGVIDQGDPIADSDEEMVEVLQILARRAGSTERSLSTSQPILDLQLPGGERLAATYQVSHRPYAVIRQHNTLDVTLDDISGGSPHLDEMLDPLMRDFLRASVAAGLNIMVAGRAGAGKTTMLRALASEIPSEEPFILLEEARELGLHRNPHHQWVMSFESRDGHGEKGADGRPAGEITIADLIPVSLRMGTQRIIVGEVRSREIVPMLEAMTTSRGSMCTIHARTAASVPDRIIQLALSYGPSMTADLAQRTAANGLDLIVYVNLDDETGIGGRKHRYVSTIQEVTGTAAGGRISHTTIFGPSADGRAAPQHLPERVRGELMAIGYDARVLSRWIDAGHGAWSSRSDRIMGRAG